MQKFGRSALVKGGAIAPLLVPGILLAYLMAAPVSMGVVHAGEAMVYGVMLGAAVILGYVLFLITGLPAYLVTRNKSGINTWKVVTCSGTLGLFVAGPLVSYLVLLSEAKLLPLDVVLICVASAVASSVVMALFLSLAKKFTNGAINI